MTLTELSTMAQFNIGAKVIILNNVSEQLPVQAHPCQVLVPLWQR